MRSRFSSLWTKNSVLSERAPGLAALIVSQIWTRTAYGPVLSTSSWCAATAFTTAGSSPARFRMSAPSAAWVPFRSWSTAFPMSWRSPARCASDWSSPSSAAMVPARDATSMECARTLWEKLVRYLRIPRSLWICGGSRIWKRSAAACPVFWSSSSNSARVASTSSSTRDGWMRPS